MEDTAAASNGDYTAFHATPLTFEGTTYTSPYHLADMVGITIGPTGSFEDSPETAAFKKLYAQAQQSGALADPAVKTLVGTMVNDIYYLSDGFQGAIGDMRDATGLANLNQGIVNKMNPSTLTHSDSAIICVTGGGADTGTACP